MTESRLIIDLLNTRATFTQIRGFILSLSPKGKYVEVKTSDPAIAGIVTGLIGNANVVIIINGIVVNSFDSNYVIGDVVGWLAGFETVTF